MIELTEGVQALLKLSSTPYFSTLSHSCVKEFVPLFKKEYIVREFIPLFDKEDKPKFIKDGTPSRIRTSECRNQNPMP